MSQATSDDVEQLLENWAEAKSEMAILEKKIEKYKLLANKIMNSNATDQISSSYFKLNRREQSRNTITKQDLPVDIWDRYSRMLSYPVYYLSKNVQR